MISTLTAVHMHKVLSSGRSHPVILGCIDAGGQNAGDFVVKLAGAMDTRERGPASELIASFLASHFGILHPSPAAVRLHPDLIHWLARRQPEIATVLRSSSGLNFGTSLLVDVSTWPVGHQVPEGMMTAAANIFAFDAVIANDDRRIDNPNVLVRGDDLFAIDHEAAFSFLYLVTRNNPSWEVRDRRSLRDHVFFYQLRKREIDLSLFTARLSALGDEELEAIVREMPAEWRHDDIGRICAHLQAAREHAGDLERQIFEVLA